VEFIADRSGLAAIRLEAESAVVPELTEAIFADSQIYVPVLTGDLQASGHTEYDGGTGYVVYGNEDVDYAAYQEVGTSKMDAQPYLRPAAYRVRSL
jgi:HK97 gp10 family phage protein